MLLQYGQLLENTVTIDVLKNFLPARDAHPVCQITYNRDAWVNLSIEPSDYSFVEALLLCQINPETWLAWVPDHGEITLNRRDFYLLN